MREQLLARNNTEYKAKGPTNRDTTKKVITAANRRNTIKYSQSHSMQTVQRL